MGKTQDLIDAARAVIRLSRMFERSFADLSLAHYRVLASVAAGDEQASRVAARLALAKPTISASVEALCQRGLLVRDQRSGDQRAVRLRVTPAGEQVLADTEAAMLARFAKVLERLDDPEATVRGLAELGPVLDALADERLASRLGTRAAQDAR
ncbi:MAG TPA: MarR family winged helix-turn-helix transcriptional regulator [Jatrophihabitantaceae bacterium]|nr:MarR family winged helix-turn-helix transcriptional regulator [Jatrophihabitantaceae bacterium]